MKAIAALILFLVPMFCHAEWQDWDTNDKRMFVASEALILADWMQTRKIVKDPTHYSEQNRILGDHPSMGKVNTYFLSTMIGNYFLADYLGENRMVYLGAVTIVQGAVVKHNYSLGLRAGF